MSDNQLTLTNKEKEVNYVRQTDFKESSKLPDIQKVIRGLPEKEKAILLSQN